MVPKIFQLNAIGAWEHGYAIRVHDQTWISIMTFIDWTWFAVSFLGNMVEGGFIYFGYGDKTRNLKIKVSHGKKDM